MSYEFEVSRDAIMLCEMDDFKFQLWVCVKFHNVVVGYFPVFLGFWDKAPTLSQNPKKTGR